TGETLPAGHRLVLLALLAAIVAHFVDIHFGIAIASTRVHFWTLAGLLTALYLHRIPLEAPALAPAPAVPTAKRKGAKPPQARPADTSLPAFMHVVTFSLITAVILVICGYDYITNQAGDRSALTIIARSLTAIVRGPAQFESSYGILGLFVLTWLVGGMLSTTGGLTLYPRPSRQPSARWLVYALVYAAITLIFAIPLIIWHAGRLIPYAADPANHIVVPYIAAFLGMFLSGTALFFEKWASPPRPGWGKYSAVSTLAGLILLPLAFLALVYTNMHIIQADVYFKQGKRAESLQQWDAGIAYYQKAIDLTPRQDYYYLFLGRAQLQKAEMTADTAQRERLVEQSLQALQTAQKLNPLNTDHTANLGRLYRLWAQMTDDPAKRQERFEQSLRYYAQATRLSPHNAGLFNEWGLVYYYMGRYDEAMQKYQQSLALDSEFSQTYLLMGDVYLAWEQWDNAVEAYRQALALEPDLVQAHSALGYAYARQGRIQEAIRENLYVTSVSPSDYISLRNLALLYQQIGDITNSLAYAERALPLAPEQERDPLQQLIQQLRQSLGG
ncbi:MAG: tetratricopeptide repeat protein, partial [Anaerolineae bacterium]